MRLNRILRTAAAALPAALLPLPSSAQGGSGTRVSAEGILQGAEDTLQGLAGLVINVVSVIMALIGIFMLAVNLYKYFKGDPSSNDALMKVGGGLLVAVIILQVINYTMLG